MNEPDWTAIKRGDRMNPKNRQACVSLLELPEDDLYTPLLVIGWRLGVVSVEDLEVTILGFHNAPEHAKHGVALRLLRRIVTRLDAELLKT